MTSPITASSIPRLRSTGFGRGLYPEQKERSSVKGFLHSGLNRLAMGARCDLDDGGHGHNQTVIQIWRSVVI
ncbi:hypothetical protein J6590_002562 [Homalodisca vitripennis]|nr:hypothetical protein J6590_002562 [Homalodisca vitripennis]